MVLRPCNVVESFVIIKRMHVNYRITSIEFYADRRDVYMSLLQVLDLHWKCPGRRPPDSDLKEEEETKEEQVKTPLKQEEKK